MSKPFQKILVCRTDALGDTLLTLPVCLALKQVLPQSRVDMLVSPYTQPIVENQSGVDRIIIYDAENVHRTCGGLRQLIRDLAHEEYDAALAVFPDKRIAWALFRAGIPLRVGTARRWWSMLFNRPVRHSRAQAKRHEAEYNLDLARALDLPVSMIYPQLRISENDAQWAETFFKNMDRKKDERWIVIHPGGHGSSNNWTPGQYGRLAETLIRSYSCKILLTGSKYEKPVLDSVQMACAEKLQMLEQPVTLTQLAAIIRSADVFVAGNTGPLHLAAGLGVPAVTVFPGTGVTSPVRWSPLSEKAQVLTPPADVDPLDVSAIPVEDVAKAVGRALSMPDRKGL